MTTTDPVLVGFFCAPLAAVLVPENSEIIRAVAMLPFGILLAAMGIGDAPVAGFQLHRIVALIGDRNGVSPEEIIVLRRRAIGDKARRHHHFDVAGHGTIHASDTAIFLVISLHTTTREGRLCSRQFHLARLMPHKSEQRGMLDCIAVRRSFLKPYLPTRLENRRPHRCPIEMPMYAA